MRRRESENILSKQEVFGFYWLPLRTVAVHTAVVGLSAGLPAHVPGQLHGHASFGAPLDRRALLLLALPLWIKRQGGEKRSVYYWRLLLLLLLIIEVLNSADSGYTTLPLHVYWFDQHTPNQSLVGTDNILFLIQRRNSKKQYCTQSVQAKQQQFYFPKKPLTFC